MTFQPADTVSISAFLALCAAMLVVCVLAFRGTKKFLGWLGGFVTLTAVMSLSAASGLTDEYMIPVLPVIIGVMTLFGVALSLSSAGREVVDRVSLRKLVAFQSFRLPLELILHRWAVLGTIPETMTWSGSNWDVLTGIVALALFPWCARYRSVAWFAQIVGFVLLLNVFRVVLFSSGFPFSWPLENPLRLAMHFPYVLILPLCVLPALVGHLLTFRKLARTGAPREAVLDSPPPVD